MKYREQSATSTWGIQPALTCLRLRRGVREIGSISEDLLTGSELSITTIDGHTHWDGAPRIALIADADFLRWSLVRFGSAGSIGLGVVENEFNRVVGQLGQVRGVLVPQAVDNYEPRRNVPAV